LERDLDAFRDDDFLPAKKSAVDEVLTRPSLSYWQDVWIRLKKNKQALGSLIVVIMVLCFTVFGPLIWTVDPAFQDIQRTSEAPSFGRTLDVIADRAEYEDIILEDVEAAPEESFVGDLPAPQDLALMDIPNKDAVRLKWSPVLGASGYMIYRSEYDPKSGSKGLPVGQVDAGNKVSFQDQYELTSEEFYYSVVAIGESESKFAAKLRVSIPGSISLTEALGINPDAKVGSVLVLPTHPAGTDYLGRDLLARLMAGARISLFIGLVAPFLQVVFGIIVGGISGYMGGRVDQMLMRFTDFVLGLPFLLFMILFKVISGTGPGESGVAPMLVAMVVLGWSGSARLVRGQILQLRESEFVQAARLLGAKPGYLLARHLLPNTFGVILVSITFNIPSAIFTEAFLSFIGMGVVPPTPSWGSMCNDALQGFLNHPHEFLFPAVLICIAVLAFNFLGDGLRDALDPRMRSVQ